MSRVWNLNAAEAELREPEAAAPRPRRSHQVSSVFKNLRALTPEQHHVRTGHSSSRTLVTSSRDTLEWAAQQETPTVTVDDAKAGPDSMQIDPQALQWGRRSVGHCAEHLTRRFDPQTVGRKRTLLSRIFNHDTVKVHALSRAIEQWEERVRSNQSRAREIISDDVRSEVLHIKTHIHFNLSRLPDCAAVRSEIKTFFEARQSSSKPDAMRAAAMTIPGCDDNLAIRTPQQASSPRRFPTRHRVGGEP